MTSKILPQRTVVHKVSQEWGKAPIFADVLGKLYTEQEILANHKAFEVEGRTAEQLTAQAKRAKARKSSRKSSSKSTQSNKALGSTVLGESAYTSQARTRYTAMAELVNRVNQVEVAL